MANLNYRHLGYFRAVAHDGNLTRAARRMNLSQSALSVQIRSLEEQLGHALFERRGRQLHLTEAGRIALDHADAIFAAGDDLVGTLAGTGGSRRVLRIGALATLSRNFQMQFLAPVLGLAGVELVLRSGSTAELLHAMETLDLDAVLLNRAVPRDTRTPFVSHQVAEQQVGLVAVPERLAGDRSAAELIASQPVVLPSSESGIRIGFDALCSRLGIQAQIAAEADDMAMMRLLAREGVGLAVLPPIVVKEELQSGMLVEGPSLPGVSEAFYAVTIERRFPNPLLRMLVSDKTAAPRHGRERQP